MNKPKLLYTNHQRVLFESNGRQPTGKKARAKSRLGPEENIHDGRQTLQTIQNSTVLCALKTKLINLDLRIPNRNLFQKQN